MIAPRILFKRLRPTAVVPEYKSARAAGLDLAAALDSPMTLVPGGREAVPTGLAIAIPEGWEGQVRPRSGWARDRGVTVLNAPGTLDSDFAGEVMVILVNHGPEMVTIEPGHRIAQLVIAPVAQAELHEVDDLPATDRGTGGFGSTGA